MRNYTKLMALPSELSRRSGAFLQEVIIQNLSFIFLEIIQILTPLQRRKVVIVGTDSKGIKLFRFFHSNKAVGYHLKGIFDVEKKHGIVKGDIEDLKSYCLREEIDEIYFTRSTREQSLIADLSQFADQHFIYFRIATDSDPLVQKTSEVNTYYFNDVPVMSVRKEPLASRFNQGLKRAFDIAFSLAVLAILIPFVFPIIALAIRLESRGPIFFLQDRPGRKNKLFKCWKFRSMTVNNSTEQQATKNDKRITKVGAFLRKTSLDELPQFINVLLGDMSVVGPRPNMIKQLEYYSQVIDNYSFRHFVTPGITGWAQVNGFRGETQTDDLMAKRVELDIKYMQAWSFWLDIKIIFLTVWNIVKGEENAY
ncbi:MAG: exopolysaccharide biosynthesis polyprenyl glycosylphosphotransferase [Microscillaceae bacterium]|nr:exopolysaccharide biosynthesis polyprenyl glycosylphosphotransferase [Microscillaceae bacterium]